ncbi:hypothetical protein KI387_013729, partial [Taxus chinensis]
TLRFLNNTSKPIILALGRPDPKKNMKTLVKDFRECNKLKKLENLGFFINLALVEPFGLTLIEETTHGLPMVATKNGGPVDIHR